ncbi:hypothetical protein HDU76_009893 [Blyttiomyces sp. JEL0837]|nr:hypothetical protein HDU76_009893 [Blyttiomyces sp. JEL0837]
MATSSNTSLSTVFETEDDRDNIIITGAKATVLQQESMDHQIHQILPTPPHTPQRMTPEQKTSPHQSSFSALKDAHVQSEDCMILDVDLDREMEFQPQPQQNQRSLLTAGMIMALSPVKPQTAVARKFPDKVNFVEM